MLRRRRTVRMGRGWGGGSDLGTRPGMEGEVAIFLGVPVKAGEVSWRHDRRQDGRSCARG